MNIGDCPHYSVTTSKKTTVIAIAIVLSIITISFLLFIRTPLEEKEHNAYLKMYYVSGAQGSFRSDKGGYASTWEELLEEPGPSRVQPYLTIDLSKSSGGYTFTLKPAGDKVTGSNGTTLYTDYVCIAEPNKYGRDGNKSYYIDSSAIIRVEIGKAASKTSNYVEPDPNYRSNVQWTM
jgi:hypothetical protein